MDLSFLDKTSKITPALVNLYDSYSAYTSDETGAHENLAETITALFENDFSPRESELIADILMALVRDAEKNLRMALSERLSIIENAPLRLILQIANDEIDVAQPVLQNSYVLDDQDLIYIIKSKGPDYWRAIAMRKNMNDDVMNVLADTKDMETAATLAANTHVNLPQHTMIVLSELAKVSDIVAGPLLNRNDVSDDVVRAVYQYVGQHLKDQVTQSHPLYAAQAHKEIDDLVFEMAEAVQGSTFSPTNTMLRAADRFKEKGMLTSKLMLSTLNRGQISSFVAQFSRLTNLSPHVVEQMLKQSNGQGLAIACKAYDITQQDFSSIYLRTTRVRNMGGFIDQKDLSKALSYYNKVEQETARRILDDTLIGTASVTQH